MTDRITDEQWREAVSALYEAARDETGWLWKDVADRYLATLTAAIEQRDRIIEAADALAAATEAACDGLMFDTLEDEDALKALDAYRSLRGDASCGTEGTSRAGK